VFEKDSLYYYLTDSSYKNQTRYGVTCKACDEFAESNYQKRLQILDSNSRVFNSNNKFINTLCNDELGELLFYKSLITDTLRSAHADSSVMFYTEAVNSILASRKKMVQFFKNEKSKNEKKPNFY
jgi:hypothetical protein